ncbi:MAG: exo-alpha-sialidase [Myxococcales bacterium]|nr:exo-alpha-sialidase [Myxococcales bacterium]
MQRILLLLFACLYAGVAGAATLVNDVTLHDQTLPAIAVDGETVYVVWQDGSTFQADVRLAVSENGGLSFEPSVMPDEPAPFDQIAPDLAVAPGGDLYLVWADWRNEADYDLYLAVSEDHGASFAAPRLAPAAVSGTQVEPSIAVGDDGTIYLAWADNRRSTAEDSGIRWDVRAAVSRDGGLTFADETTLNPADDVFALFPEIAATTDGAVAVWFDLSRRIWARVSRDGGVTWDEPIRLDLDEGARADFPRVAAAGDRIAVVWNDAAESAAGQDPSLVYSSGRCNDVYLALSEDGGLTWSTATRVNSELQLNQQYPTAAFDGTALLVAWSDDRSVGDYTIQGVVATSPWDWPAADTQWDDYAGVTLRDRPDLAGRALVWQDARSGDWDIHFSWIEERAHE